MIPKLLSNINSKDPMYPGFTPYNKVTIPTKGLGIILMMQIYLRPEPRSSNFLFPTNTEMLRNQVFRKMYTSNSDEFFLSVKAPRTSP